MYTVGIVATYKDKAGRDPWPLEAVSKDYKIRDVMELLQWAEEQGEDRISFTISEVGRLGAVFDKAGDFELMEPLPGEYELGITAADVRQEAEE